MSERLSADDWLRTSPDLLALDQVYEEAYGPLFEGEFEPKQSPKPELSIDLRDILLANMRRIIECNMQLGRHEEAPNYYTTVSPIDNCQFYPSLEDKLAMKLSKYKAADMEVPIMPQTPLYVISYHVRFGEYGLKVTHDPKALISIPFRTPEHDVPVFIPSQESIKPFDRSLCDADVLALMADMNGAKLFYNPEQLGQAA